MDEQAMLRRLTGPETKELTPLSEECLSMVGHQFRK